MSAPRYHTISSPFYIGAEETVFQVYSEVTTALLDHVSRLTLIAESLLTKLESLEEQLDLIHELVFEEEFIASAKDQLLSRLWMRLGGNRQDVWNLKLLSEIGESRRKAKAYVGSALHTLDALNRDLNDLREQSFNQGSAGSEISIKAQIEGIGNGVQRLRNMVQVKQRPEPEVAFAQKERPVLH